MIYFALKEKPGRTDAGERFIDYIADKAYCITLAVSLGQVKTLIENPYSMTHSAYQGACGNGLEHEKKRQLDPGGIRLSIGLEDRHDIIADLEKALAQA
jgi:cystathionine beta-lyase/cystathionine gamma-synthase